MDNARSSAAIRWVMEDGQGNSSEVLLSQQKNNVKMYSQNLESSAPSSGPSPRSLEFCSPRSPFYTPNPSPRSDFSSPREFSASPRSEHSPSPRSDFAPSPRSDYSNPSPRTLFYNGSSPRTAEFSPRVSVSPRPFVQRGSYTQRPPFSAQENEAWLKSQNHNFPQQPYSPGREVQTQHQTQFHQVHPQHVPTHHSHQTNTSSVNTFYSHGPDSKLSRTAVRSGWETQTQLKPEIVPLLHFNRDHSNDSQDSMDTDDKLPPIMAITSPHAHSNDDPVRLRPFLSD